MMRLRIDLLLVLLLSCLAVHADGPKTKWYGNHYSGSKKPKYKYQAYTKRGKKYKHGDEFQYYRTGTKRIHKKVQWRHGVKHGQYLSLFDSKDVKVKTEGTYEKGKKTGTWLEWYRIIKKKKVANFKDDKLHGRFQEWAEDGQELERKTYRNGKKSGQELAWYSDGKKRSVAVYKDGVLEGKCQSWYKNGKPRSVIEYVNRKRQGVEQLWKEDGKPVSETTYRAGIRHGPERLWWNSGKPKSETTYFEDKKDGPEKIYDFGGNIQSETVYVKGTLQGLQVRYFANGKKRSEVFYNGGRRDGTSRSWFANGKLRNLVTLRLDKNHGPAEVHDMSGNLVSKGFYKNGRPVNGTFLYSGDTDRCYTIVTYKKDAITDEVFHVDNKPYAGVWQTFYDVARLQKRRSTTYKDGRRAGAETMWYENGREFFELNWNKDQLDGNLTQWHPSGKKSWDVQFVHGAKNGFERAWDVRGDAVCEGEWRKGKPWNGTVIMDEDVVQVTSTGEEKIQVQVVKDYRKGKLLPGIPKQVVRTIAPVKIKYEQTVTRERGKKKPKTPKKR